MSSRLPAHERREQLLDRALELFAAKGYARATTSPLAKAAGVTEPIIYRHFKSKKELFVALIERTGQETLEQWSRELEPVTDPAERLKKLIGENPMVSPRGRATYRVFLQAITEVDDPEIKAAIQNHIGSLRLFLQREISRAQEEHKVFTRFSAELIAKLLCHLGMGYGTLTAMEIPEHGNDASGRHVQELIGLVLVGRRAEGEGKGEAPKQ